MRLGFLKLLFDTTPPLSLYLFISHFSSFPLTPSFATCLRKKKKKISKIEMSTFNKNCWYITCSVLFISCCWLFHYCPNFRYICVKFFPHILPLKKMFLIQNEVVYSVVKLFFFIRLATLTENQCWTWTRENIQSLFTYQNSHSAE